MPELPEVETIKQQIEAHLVGSIVAGVSTFRTDVIHGEVLSIMGSTITGARRFGKLLVIDTSKDISLCVHLKMTGRLTLLPVGETFPKHTHVVFHLQPPRSETQLVCFSDARRFGYIHFLPTTAVQDLPFVKSLGKEPLKDLTKKEFELLCARSKRPIKMLLLDQHRIAGIGNIYACEALWMSFIHPATPAQILTRKQMQALFANIEAVLTEGIERGGASDNSYRNLMGGKGKYQDFFKVYGRTGKPCVRCSTPIERIVIGGRGTFCCPVCQK
jgi:formamidopyrimidine-DNA glycosylase